ncbi:MAG: tRNA pseudouridine(55) synthase TruB [Clostridia bacterium]|nr:tRNA pseudouridine(55) synthase TruB [Clostridia bacterium]
MDGFINLLKPPGMSSNDAVGFARRLLPRGTRVGHGGTLDPDAAGVLPVCVGKAARLFDYIIDKKKTYVAGLCLGVETDTQDAGGHILARRDASAVTEADIRAVLPRFTGDIDQIPPAYSAIKRDGRRMYDLARRGEAVELEPRRVTVHSIDCLQKTGPAAYMLRVACGKGVYIRTLCHDIGRMLGVGGHMSFLLRTEAGCFRAEDASTLEELQSAAQTGRLESLLYPMDAPLSAYPAVRLDERHMTPVSNGCAIPPEWHGQAFAMGDIARIYVADTFAGMAQADGEENLRFRAMLMEKN